MAGEKLFGEAPAPSVAQGARVADRLVGVAVTSGRWLRLLAVAPDARGAGVGTALVEAARQAARRGGAPRLATCAQPGNYLSPGVLADDADTLGWLARRGFGRQGEHFHMTVPLVDNPRVTVAEHAESLGRAASLGYELGRALPETAAEVATLVGATFGAAWACETRRAFEGEPAGVHVARRDGTLVAFAVRDGNNRGLGCFGPAGTWPEHRGKGLGTALLLACLRDLADAGQKSATIAWIGPRSYYEQQVGACLGDRFEVWDVSA